MSIDEVARRLEISPATIQRYETERGAVRAVYVRNMLALYETPARLNDALLDVARTSRQRGWWAAYGDVLAPDFEEYVGLEAEAMSLRAYDTHLVHGLLQTEAYARALLTAIRRTDGESIDRLVALRMQRQNLFERKQPFALWAIIDEAVLRRPVGGSAVMAEQLRRLRKVSEMPGVTLQVMPFARGAHSGSDGAFSIMEFPGRGDPDVVYVDCPAGNLYVEKDRDVAWFTLVFDHMRAEALPPDESRACIEAAAEELGT